MPLTSGQVLRDRYRIIKLLGQGGYGAVYRAWDGKLGGPCAIKESYDADETAAKQFAREASLLFNLRHPNLPRVFDTFSIPGQGQYLVMDFIEGEDLGAMLKEAGGPLPESRVLPWIVQVCQALSYMHAQSPPVIHRDIKPANIRITPGGQAVLVDFGIAKAYNPDMPTTTGARAVTPGFSPPEQYSQGATDAQSDVYALGATLYALLSGKPPPDSVDRLVHSAKTLPPLHEINPAVSQPVSAAVHKAMLLEKEGRYPSTTAFQAALTRRGGETLFAPSPQAVQHPAAAPSTVTHSLVERLSTAPPSAPLTGAPAGQASRLAPRLLLPLALMAALGVCLIFGGTGAYVLLRGGTTATQQSMFANAPPVQQGLPPPGNITPAAGTQATPLPIQQNLPPLGNITPTADAQATPLPGEQDEPRTGAAMLLVPAGEFIMGGYSELALQECEARVECTQTELGSLPAEMPEDFRKVLIESYRKALVCDAANYQNQEPAHSVYLDAFYIDRTEVTNAQYALCVQAGACTPPDTKFVPVTSNGFGMPMSPQTAAGAAAPTAYLPYYEDPQFASHPMVNLTWGQAHAFCGWRSARLPSEAEWEKAGRGADGRLYPWGNTYEAGRARVCEESCAVIAAAQYDPQRFIGTAPVGSYPQGASPYGVLDLVGNVAEWVNDWYIKDYYVDSPAANPPGPFVGEGNVVRGSSWQVETGPSLPPRYMLPIDNGYYFVGFRCARSP